jgi:hypothetical protein
MTTGTASISEATLSLVTRFEEGFNDRDWDATMADMTEDCVFEHVAPAAVSSGRPSSRSSGSWTVSGDPETGRPSHIGGTGPHPPTQRGK